MKDLKVFWGHTTSTGHAYYRSMMWALEMKNQGLGAHLYMNWDPRKTGYTPVNWEWRMENPKERDKICDDIVQVASRCDVLNFQHVQYKTSLALIKMLQDHFKKPLVSDFDDYAFDIPITNPAAAIFTPGSEKLKITKAQLMESDALIVPNEYLRNKYLFYNKNIYIIPNALDFDIWDKLEKKENKKDKIRIGYIAAGGHILDKQLLKLVIPEILKKYKNVEFVFVGEPLIEPWMLEYKNSGRLKLITHWENILDYPAYMNNLKFDIGLAPLRDSEFNRAKSNLRYLEYSAMKVPTVASNVENYRKTITDGDNGFLVTETEEWIKTLSLLVEDVQLRKDIALRAYHNVKDNFNLKQWAPKYFDVLNKIKEEHNDRLSKG